MYKRKAIIFDIDGTLANNEHRQHFLIEETKNWEEFFCNMSKDSPIEPIRTVCASLIANREMVRSIGCDSTFDVIFCTGRPSNYRGATMSWLKRYIFPNYHINDIPLYMRTAGDKRPDDVVKEELLERIRKDGYEPFLVFDDRQRVVDMWRRNGIQCCQVAPGDF